MSERSQGQRYSSINTYWRCGSDLGRVKRRKGSMGLSLEGTPVFKPNLESLWMENQSQTPNIFETWTLFILLGSCVNKLPLFKVRTESPFLTENLNRMASFFFSLQDYAIQNHLQWYLLRVHVFFHILMSCSSAWKSTPVFSTSQNCIYEKAHGSAPSGILLYHLQTQLSAPSNPSLSLTLFTTCFLNTMHPMALLASCSLVHLVRVWASQGQELCVL